MNFFNYFYKKNSIKELFKYPYKCILVGIGVLQ